LFIGSCRQSDNHPQEDLAKSGYKPDIKYKPLIILLYVWLHNDNHIYESGDFTSFFFLAPFWRQKTSKIILFVISSFFFRILAIYRQVKKDRCQHRLLPASAAAAAAVREPNWGSGYGVVVVQCRRHQ
jgi:hypothetical protein